MPTLIFVHGACVRDTDWWWSRMVDPLADRGIASVAVPLPSCGETGDELGDLHDDVAACRDAIAGAEGPVVLLGHSYGGVIITEAGADDRVAGLLYVTSVMPDAGQSQADLIGAEPAPWLDPSEDGTIGVHPAPHPRVLPPGLRRADDRGGPGPPDPPVPRALHPAARRDRLANEAVDLLHLHRGPGHPGRRPAQASATGCPSGRLRGRPPPVPLTARGICAKRRRRDQPILTLTRAPAASTIPGFGDCATTLPVFPVFALVTLPILQSADAAFFFAALSFVAVSLGTVQWGDDVAEVGVGVEPLVAGVEVPGADEPPAAGELGPVVPPGCSEVPGCSGVRVFRSARLFRSTGPFGQRLVEERRGRGRGAGDRRHADRDRGRGRPRRHRDREGAFGDRTEGRGGAPEMDRGGPLQVGAGDHHGAAPRRRAFGRPDRGHARGRLHFGVETEFDTKFSDGGDIDRRRGTSFGQRGREAAEGRRVRFHEKSEADLVGRVGESRPTVSPAWIGRSVAKCSSPVVSGDSPALVPAPAYSPPPTGWSTRR